MYTVYVILYSAMFIFRIHVQIYSLQSRLLQLLHDTAVELGHNAHMGGTMLTIEGPRFSSKAESKMWNRWGAHCINMTTVPEVTTLDYFHLLILGVNLHVHIMTCIKKWQDILYQSSFMKICLKKIVENKVILRTDMIGGQIHHFSNKWQVLIGET